MKAEFNPYFLILKPDIHFITTRQFRKYFPNQQFTSNTYL